MVATTLTPARALRQPRWPDLRAMVGLLLMLAAVGGAIVAWTAAENTRPIVVAVRDLPSGAIVSPDDLTVRRVRVDDSIYNAAVPGADLNTVVGRQLAEPVHSDQVLVQAQLSPRPAVAPGQIVLTIPLRPDNAAGGRLRPGDVVQVLATSNTGKDNSRTSVILPQATIYDVGREDQAAVVGSTSSGQPAPASGATWAALIVSQDQALQLANARWNSDLDVALVPSKS
jgi:Flp pilus assembly protein CpaB